MTPEATESVHASAIPEEVHEKLKKLLRRSEGSGSTEGEMEQALAAAMRLAEKHRINLSDINLEDPQTADEIRQKEDLMEKSFNVSEGKHRRPPCNKFVVNILVEFFSVEVIYTEEASRLLIIGRESDVAFAIYVYGYLKHTFTKLWRKAKREHNLQMSERASFFYATWTTLRKKLKDEQGSSRLQRTKELKVGANQYALAIHQEDITREAFKKELHPRLTYTKVKFNSNAFHGTAFESGLEAGAGININKPLK